MSTKPVHVEPCGTPVRIVNVEQLDDEQCRLIRDSMAR
jgi:hypothetical protein